MNLKNWSPLNSLDEELLNRIRLVCVFEREVLMVTSADEVFACGTNVSGCLGLEDTAPRFKVDPITGLHKKRVKGFTFGGTTESLFVVAHTYTGAVYVWGKNCGTGEVNPVLKPMLMDWIPKRVKEVACGTEHFLALSFDGEVFSWGSSSQGQLGFNSRNRVAVPTKIEGILTGKLVMKISCGSKFSTAVLDNGEVYAWGSNMTGQLGLNNSSDCSLIPQKVSNLSDTIIKKIFCGPTYVLAISDMCHLYVWGSNEFGELGLGDTVRRQIPIKNETVGRVTNIAASFICYTSAALTENFKVLMWGHCAGLTISVPTETGFECLNEVFSSFSIPCIMHKPMTRQLGYESVNETIKKAFGDKESSDLIIMAEGKEIFVHRAILRLRSDYFRVFLQEHWVDESERYISMDQSYDALYAYFRFIYTGELKTEPELALVLLSLADEYNDRLLKKLCEKIIQNGITVENVATLYAIALKLEGKKLLKSCSSFAANHINEIVDTSGFFSWDVKTMREFFLECRKRNLFRS